MQSSSRHFSNLFPNSFDRLVHQSVSLLFPNDDHFLFPPLRQQAGLRGLGAHQVKLLEAEGSEGLVTLDISRHRVFIFSQQIGRFGTRL